ncbi:MAG: HNH endonuclease [Chitinophagaceae bacterium]
MAVRKPIRLLKNEKWKDLPGHESKEAVWYKYAVSDHGRIVKYNKKIEDGFLLRLSREGGYPIWRKRMDGSYFAALLHRLVAKYFLPKPTAKQKFIIHLDHNKENNSRTNLKWATQQEVTEHNKSNPRVKAFLKERKANHFVTWSKLTEAKVIAIKKMLQKEKTLKEIASKYGVSDMQVHRIKTGENWSHIKVPKK